ncbi:DUF2244 domain-containing protein [Oceaniradius stylonematis]|uniref:DUF2244 domain-containing protein n=1 Tax=Oceaniradius stylonematis TaxID=2184161 RepID=A0A3A8AKL9_9HYPH|nr:DUF2244 domain-containing protein [Oceaniradius stylonematis]RKF07214.1 DUF2244 domain-containing protein [Oceaniradius stylonematis]
MSVASPDIEPAAPAEKTVFAAELFPHRSLTPGGFALLMGVFAAICAGNAVFYFALGAWPVAIFMIVDVLILYLAIRLSFRAGRAREQVTVTRSDVHIRKIAPNGRHQDHHYNPFWARFHIDRHSEIGITAMRLTGQGRATSIGAFLNPDDRESFATAFSQALATARR